MEVAVLGPSCFRDAAKIQRREWKVRGGRLVVWLMVYEGRSDGVEQCRAKID